MPLKTGNECLDIFLADGDSMIIRPQHLGIVNGMASVGISHDYVGVIDGLWAPPYVSSNFFIEPRIFGERIKTEHYTWLPFQAKRAGRLKGIAVTSTTTLIYGMRAGILTLNLKNTTSEKKEIPVQFIANDPSTYNSTLDYVKEWEFSAPKSQSPATDIIDNKGINRVQGEYAVAIGGDLAGLWWEELTRRFHGTITLGPGQEKTTTLVFSIGMTGNAINERDAILANPAEHIKKATANYISRVENIFFRLPRFYSDNKDLEQLYNRSLSIFITNKAEVPDFVVNPHYGTGAVKGGCTCNYLWNFGQIREILPLLDPEADRAHILQYLRTNCVDKYFAFYPMTGEPFGAWYLVNHEKITGLTYDYVKLTGDADFLNVKVKEGKSVLDLMIDCALFGDDLTKPVALINYAKYGSVNSHLELRRTGLGFEYSHVMPDANGRRYRTFFKVSELCKLAGKPQPFMMERAEQLKSILKKELWDPDVKWFSFINSKGQKDVRWTIQMYKLFEGNVLDEEEKQGLLSHLNEEEFFSPYGLHSLSKKDPGYDQVDVDNGGGGICTSFPPLIAEFLYKGGNTEAADEIMKRLLWWGRRMPYLGDSQVANEIDYRQDTPLQSDIDTGCLAQCILFGMFGINAGFDGSITINPANTKLANKLEVRGLKIRGKTLDISVTGDRYEVVSGDKTFRNNIGAATVIED
ncbi:MAG: hypothetical protein NTV01_17895 [Bacteroidia bacterium]|nr:hypothetical protein [Bacteroidia bacterium]